MTSYKSSINSANNIQSFPNRQFNLQLPTLIETERMQLIKPHPDYFPKVTRMLQDPEGMKYVTTGARSNAQAKLETSAFQKDWERQGWGAYFLLNKQTKDVMGAVKLYLSDRSPYLQIGYFLDVQYWGKGYATEAAKMALKLGFYGLNQPRIDAFAHINNIPSRHILEKIGMTSITDQFIYDGRQYAQYIINHSDYQI
ncbi:acetyltransferase, putative [Planktothrix agardhii CCAP 1459/11A]|jgi:ribosomal-protein-alanine N-acetyltransferase|uniref:Acetyltransferase, putative n=1 Tax=Planktothrix agardhii CCAP 1459/11A TaxID=282420 RepID=A0A4P5ZI64_PLAAG|nr:MULTISPECIES: GNAT family N-acetyltransferase [Planktothrix]GDZ95838.1 acetyltransferase, putative [Planktothrix agardhii CCAP 1459/11A]CAD5950840.1 putative N-acetyltransferase p20 [Planktothrix rubescens]CAH2570893.1 putative N-acetyltransferase p20 [Planktothrix rubescens]